ncbi:MmgE/PrpD family protein [Mameliella alba]|nr:MmgE/PrpD family protein [Antarctobacter heliothermus]MBY6143821.1 MmgE/PrpD family protein [Mameliella alba]MCA0952455.1 MmgE/PrpD family protein [Mameliella alba]
MLKPLAQTFSERFAEWATQSDLRMADQDRAEARFTLVDTLACTVVGTQEQQPVAAVEAALFGQQDGSVMPVGGGQKLSLTGAALVNGARAHAIDFDDYELSGSSHASAPIYSALFALAGVVPMTVDQICDAWIVGYEAIIWMGMAMGYRHYDIGWHSTSTLGPVGAAAAASRALGLSAGQMSNAMALAASSAAGLKMQFGSDAKALHAGLAAQAGVQAALLARAGATANNRLWHGKYGFASLYGGEDAAGFDDVLCTMQPGRALEKFPVIRKLWPSCAYTHRPIAAAERLHKRLRAGDEIASITVRMPEPFHRVAGFFVPTNDAEARFSVSYCVVVGLLTGHVSPEDFREHRFTDATRVRMTQDVVLDLYDLPKGDAGDIGPSTPERIVVTLTDGRVLEEVVEHVPGGVSLPMTREQLLRKVADCGCSTDLAQAFLSVDGATALADTGMLSQVGHA